MAKWVTTSILQLLGVGDSVILNVKQLLPYGAGNQKFDVTRTNKQSIARTSLAQKAYGSDWHRPLRNAGAAILYGAGNCQEQAAVAYALLRDRLSDQTYASFCVSWPYSHSFATIGNPDKDQQSEVIVVDPWPKYAQAVLLEDHFVSDKKITVLRSKTCGKSGKILKAKSKYNLDKYKISTNIILSMFDVDSSPAPYNQLYCTKNNKKIEYTDDLLTF